HGHWVGATIRCQLLLVLVLRVGGNRTETWGRLVVYPSGEVLPAQLLHPLLEYLRCDRCVRLVEGVQQHLDNATHDDGDRHECVCRGTCAVERVRVRSVKRAKVKRRWW